MATNFQLNVKAIIDSANIQEQIKKIKIEPIKIQVDLGGTNNSSSGLNGAASGINAATSATKEYISAINDMRLAKEKYINGTNVSNTYKSESDLLDKTVVVTKKATTETLNYESAQKRNEKSAQDYIRYLQQQASEEQKLSNQEAILRKQFDDRVASNSAGIQTLKVRMTGLTDEQLRLVNAEERLGQIQSMTNVDQQAKAIRSLTADMNAASRGTNTFAATLQYMTERFVQIGMYVAIFRKLTSAISDMIETVSSLDKSLVELRKVTDMTDSQLESFTKTAFEVGDAVARTGQEVIDAAAIFKRSGYEINESLDLSKAAMTMLNVGDGIDNVSDAATTLISVLKGYNLEADKAMEVTSLINEVSNNASINFEDLAEGLTRTSAVFNQAGVSMGKLSGLLTGTQEILQNIIFKIRYLKYSAYVQKCA
ncbi:MAG: phage tail tape measure protein [Candidatus Riflebacteria bacterium]|nr:phage tail tape measure protein [Candidatus Riflebacteria bacterium]